jgi:hypothetical protein
MQDVSTLVTPARARFPRRAFAVAVLLLLLGAAIVWMGTIPREPVSDPELRSLRAEAAQASAAVARLESRVADMRSDLKTLDASNERMRSRLGKVSTGLWGSLDRLRASLREARGTAAGANQEAMAALERAENAARNLSVLEDRFEYHLRSDHGGG